MPASVCVGMINQEKVRFSVQVPLCAIGWLVTMVIIEYVLIKTMDGNVISRG